TSAEAFDLKVDAMKRWAKVDFGLWGGLVPGNLDQLRELVGRGAIGFKAFMCPSGIDEFPASDEGTLRDGMARIAELGSILLVHAELPAALQTPRGTGAGDFIRSRPPQAELEAIGEAIGIARDTGCRLHVVHVSTVQGMTLIQEAQLHGVDVSGETCPHYLLYAEEDLAREDVVRREDLLYRNPFSAHEGQRIRGLTVNTLVRGEEPTGGRLIRPAAGL